MSHPSIFSSQASHARRAASEIERAIRGVGSRREGDHQGSRGARGLDFRGRRRSMKEASARRKRRNAATQDKNAGVRRMDVSGQSSGE